jgi:spore maturation protein SpmA
MNRIFYAMIAVAFVTAGVREAQLASQPPPAPVAAPAPAPAPDPTFDDSVEGQLQALSHRLGQLEKPAPAPAAPPEPPKRPIIAFTDGLFDMAKAAVMTIVLPLIGAMAFFLGLMKVAEKSGLMAVFAKLLRPLMIWLFPDVPANHPAMSAMILNMSANALGLGNAATPFGLAAMKELDKLNGEKGTATNAMCLFLAINTSSVTLLPTGVIAVRATMGSANPEGILATTLFATLLSTASAIVACKIFQRFSPPPAALVDERVEVEGGAYPLAVSVAAIAALVAFVPVALFYGDTFGPWVVPALVMGFLSYGVWAGVPVYEAFVEGAREGYDTAVKIIPYLVAILCAVGMLRGSGAIDAFVGLVGPFSMAVGLPPEALPMALLRPLSGSGAYGVMMATMTEHGPDSYVGYVVGTMQGSTETTFYVLAVYFGAVQVQKIRHAMAAALTADVVGLSAAVASCWWLFSMNGWAY